MLPLNFNDLLDPRAVGTTILSGMCRNTRQKENEMNVLLLRLQTEAAKPTEVIEKSCGCVVVVAAAAILFCCCCCYT